MKRITILFAIGLFLIPAVQASAKSRPAELQKLDIATGHWVFHGKSMGAASGKTGPWTWDADCRWSADRLYLLCLFHNTWSGQPVKSLVVDTWNSHDKSYWHYEMFSAGASGEHPFSSRMAIMGNRWIEYGHSEDHGKEIDTRIVYVYASSTRVHVEIQVSRDGKSWKTVDSGEGVKKAG